MEFPRENGKAKKENPKISSTPASGTGEQFRPVSKEPSGPRRRMFTPPAAQPIAQTQSDSASESQQPNQRLPETIREDVPVREVNEAVPDVSVDGPADTPPPLFEYRTPVTEAVTSPTEVSPPETLVVRKEPSTGSAPTLFRRAELAVRARRDPEEQIRVLNDKEIFDLVDKARPTMDDATANRLSAERAEIDDRVKDLKYAIENPKLRWKDKTVKAVGVTVTTAGALGYASAWSPLSAKGLAMVYAGGASWEAWNYIFKTDIRRDTAKKETHARWTKALATGTALLGGELIYFPTVASDLVGSEVGGGVTLGGGALVAVYLGRLARRSKERRLSRQSLDMAEELSNNETRKATTKQLLGTESNPGLLKAKLIRISQDLAAKYAEIERGNSLWAQSQSSGGTPLTPEKEALFKAHMADLLDKYNAQKEIEDKLKRAVTGLETGVVEPQSKRFAARKEREEKKKKKKNPEDVFDLRKLDKL